MSVVNEKPPHTKGATTVVRWGKDVWETLGTCETST